MSKTAHFEPSEWKRSDFKSNDCIKEPIEQQGTYSIKVYSLSFDGKKTLIADVFNVDKDVLLKILDVYGNANFEINIVSIANIVKVGEVECI